MAFPEPKPRAPELPRKLVKTLTCGQGAVRAVRFNGELPGLGAGRPLGRAGPPVTPALGPLLQWTVITA